MSRKTKLISLITSFCLMLTLLVVGVFAAANVSLDIGGSITFVVPKTVSAVISNDTTSTTVTCSDNTKLQPITFTKGEVTSGTKNSWTGLDLGFSGESTTADLVINIENKAKNTIWAKITTSSEKTNNNITTSISSIVIEIERDGNKNVTISFTVDNPDDFSANEFKHSFSLGIELTDEGQETIRLQPQMKPGSTTEVDYYYVTMGEYQGEPVRWRYVGYVADDGTYTRDTSGAMPSGENGIFVQETGYAGAVEFCNEYEYVYHYMYTCYHTEDGLTKVTSDDYATSNVRKFLNGETVYTSGELHRGGDISDDGEISGEYYTPTGEQVNLFNLYNLSDGDKIYSQITPRTLKDLYGNATYPSDTNVPPNTTQDKLWLLSEDEANALFDGDSARIWKAGTNTAYAYWTRTPGFGGDGGANFCSIITKNGSNGDTDVSDSETVVRAAFLLKI